MKRFQLTLTFTYIVTQLALFTFTIITIVNTI